MNNNIKIIIKLRITRIVVRQHGHCEATLCTFRSKNFTRFTNYWSQTPYITNNIFRSTARNYRAMNVFC